MKIMNFCFKKSEILERVAETTAYTGARHPSDDNASLFRRVYAAEEDGGLLGGFWIEACARLCERLKPFVTASSVADGEFLLTLSASGMFDQSQELPLATGLTAFLISEVASRWFRISFPEGSAEHEACANRLLDEAERRLYHRLPPRRKHDA